MIYFMLYISSVRLWMNSHTSLIDYTWASSYNGYRSSYIYVINFRLLSSSYYRISVLCECFYLSWSSLTFMTMISSFNLLFSYSNSSNLLTISSLCLGYNILYYYQFLLLLRHQLIDHFYNYHLMCLLNLHHTLHKHFTALGMQ